MRTESKPRALVTGATGFVGSRLCSHLEREGWALAALYRPSAGDRTVNLPADCRRYPYTGQTLEVITCLTEFRPDVVFHLASLFVAQHTAAQIDPLVAANILFGTQLLEAMQIADAKVLVNAGTTWQNARGDAYHPVNLYAATKQAFECLLAYYVEARGFHAVTLRLSDTYGPGDERPKLLQLLTRCLRTGEPLSLSPGRQVIDLVHIDDLCRAFLRAAELARNEAGAHVYAVSGAQRRTLREIVSLLEQVSGRRLEVGFGALPYREREVMLPWLGPGLPGWTPRISLLEGLKGLIARDAGLALPPPLSHREGPRQSSL